MSISKLKITPVPSPNGDNGRDNRGRFTPGNKGGTGNPYAKKAAQIRKALYEAVSADDIRGIVDAIKDKAAAGDLRAAEIILDRLLGKADIGIDVLERLEALEKAIQSKNEEPPKWES